MKKLLAAILATGLLVSVDANAKSAKVCGKSHSSVADVFEYIKNNPEIDPAAGNDEYVAFALPREAKLWTFTTEKNDTHPAVICREVVERNGAMYIDMSALCEDTKRKCDNLIEQFEKLNDQVREEMRSKASGE